MYTKSAKTAEADRKWIVVDADGAVVGRLATFIAKRLRGKHRADFTPHADVGDFVFWLECVLQHQWWERDVDSGCSGGLGAPHTLLHAEVPFAWTSQRNSLLSKRAVTTKKQAAPTGGSLAQSATPLA